jgi:hypothetical protein
MPSLLAASAMLGSSLAEACQRSKYSADRRTVSDGTDQTAAHCCISSVGGQANTSYGSPH